MFILLEKGKVDRMHDANLTPICYVLVADASAAVNLQLWCALTAITCTLLNSCASVAMASHKASRSAAPADSGWVGLDNAGATRWMRSNRVI